MQIIYSRVSTVEQNVMQQAAYLKSAYPSVGKVYEDEFTGSTLDRPAFSEMRANLQTGDEVIFYDVSRIGRNTIEVLEFVNDMVAKGVVVRVHTLGGIDLTSATGKMTLTVLAAVAEMQRTEMLEKQAIGIATAKSEGKYKGRQQSPETLIKVEKVKKFIECGLSVQEACKAASIGRATFYRLK